ncbi:MlaD family protein [Pseudomonadota bacterium AL_CKDN230030165-1A_HGKHYDSX7]
MENRSHALLAGTFTLVLLVAAALIAIWVGRDRAAVTVYEIVSTTPVSGLSAQSAVRYQGVPVGKVQSLGLNPERPGQVRIRIGVAPTTPITASTWAEIGVQGVTGLANVDLRDDGSSGRRLASTEERPATIPLRPGFLERVEQRGGALLNNFEQTAEQLRNIVSPQNVQALTDALNNVTAITAQLKDASRELGPALAKAGPLVDSIDKSSREIGLLAQSARQAVARLNAPDGPLSLATSSLQDIAYAASRLDQETLPAMTNMARSVDSAARSANRTLRNVGDTPQSILFGPAPAAPGPGEAGFAGFGR